MSYPNRLAALALATGGVLLTAAAGWIAAQEGSAYTLNGGTALKTISIRSDDDPVGLGITTRMELLGNCETALRSERSFEIKLLTDTTFQEVVERCRKIAEVIGSGSANFSLAWAVAADAASRQQDWGSMNRYLLLSQKSGANEQWIGRYRFRVADEMLEHLTPEARQSYDQDLRLLILSNKGTPYMARRYVLDPGFRDRIAAVLSDVTEADQRRFVSALQRMLPRRAQ